MFRQLIEKLDRRPKANGPFVIPRSDRDRWGPLGHRRADEIKEFQERKHRRQFLIALCVACPLAFAAPFAVTFVRDHLSDPPKQRAEPPHDYKQAARRRGPARPVEDGERDEVAERPQNSGIQICGWTRGRRGGTCLVDGDTGWEAGVKWRLADVDTPEISSPGCSGELQRGLAARDRLKRLMSEGYEIIRLGSTDRYNRQLVNIRLRNGRDAGQVLLGEGLARPFPSAAKPWCNG